MRGLLLCTILSLAIPVALAHAAEPCGQPPSPFERVLPSPIDRGGDDDSGIGGTGQAPAPPSLPRALERGDDESGIGGTGHSPRPSGGGDESGIGGTGIFGTVLRAERLCVNGLEIKVPNTLQIESVSGGEGPSSLRVGQIVFVVARETATGLVATRIQLQSSFRNTPWKQGPNLARLSIEGFIVEGPNGPQLGGLPLDFRDARQAPEAGDLRPGTRVRAIGELRDGRVLRIAPMKAPRLPLELDRTPNTSPPQNNSSSAPPSPRPTTPPTKSSDRPGGVDTRPTRQPERPVTTEPPQRPEEPERPERPELPQRPDIERPAFDERPQPRVIERPFLPERSTLR